MKRSSLLKRLSNLLQKGFGLALANMNLSLIKFSSAKMTLVNQIEYHQSPKAKVLFVSEHIIDLRLL
jgi:hypothetical protein